MKTNILRCLKNNEKGVAAFKSLHSSRCIHRVALLKEVKDGRDGCSGDGSEQEEDNTKTDVNMLPIHTLTTLFFLCRRIQHLVPEWCVVHL